MYIHMYVYEQLHLSLSLSLSPSHPLFFHVSYLYSPTTPSFSTTVLVHSVHARGVRDGLAAWGLTPFCFWTLGVIEEMSGNAGAHYSRYDIYIYIYVQPIDYLGMEESFEASS